MKGTNWFSRNFKTIIYVAFLVPIITIVIDLMRWTQIMYAAFPFYFQ